MKLLPAYLSILLALSSGLFCKMQAQVSSSYLITDPGEIYADYSFTSADRDSLTGKVGVQKFEEIDRSCHENQWPSGIASLENRGKVRDQFQEYKISLTATFGHKSIIEIEPRENKHMPAEMQSPVPFYIIINSIAIEPFYDPGSPGENGDEYAVSDNEFPLAVITDPGQLLAGYKFTADEIQDISDQLGSDGFEFINENCREESWPTGINSLDKRLAAKDDIEKYTAYLVAETGEISILEINPEDNNYMPFSLQPETTFYFIIRSEGIEIDEGE